MTLGWVKIQPHEKAATFAKLVEHSGPLRVPDLVLANPFFPAELLYPDLRGTPDWPGLAYKTGIEEKVLLVIAQLESDIMFLYSLYCWTLILED